MWETSGRLLKLLSLLQARRDWSGAELADSLGVTSRTVRRDIDRLRELGYPVHALQGTAGYRLGAGGALPPLLLDDAEAVAVAIGLRTATGSSVSGIEETALRALTKLEQLLPSRLRYRVNSLHTATVRAGTAPAPEVSADTLLVIAEACRRSELLRFDYTSHRGKESSRRVEPRDLVSFGRHWYLVGFDVERADWRTFRVDRLRPRTPTGPRFTPREAPFTDVAEHLSSQLSVRAWTCQATVTLHEPAEVIAERIWPGMGVLEAVDERSCLLHIGADTVSSLVWMITSVDADFTLTSGSPELVTALRAQADRCQRALAGR
ncbi:putative DNA-binding transcriptional regulator YafY [Tamaricihabitans halophyticus]|uniref:Putative DNA-binding transcriptional regulator YafY n=1 Tax=Tamaricihabitans halophyticus TaxID=1262583 RepID=A0A4R2R429_9PSEU|nr:WYL domain-containing protein [Tamaricihabitans halophyticus]TCP56418.1 putative DNA-binding transcriptional regulator YafY [Tamaricihabitans halophyticus]